MSYRIYLCNDCGEVLGVGENFPDGGTASHVIALGSEVVHDDSSLWETPNTPPKGAQAALDWAADEINDGRASEV